MYAWYGSYKIFTRVRESIMLELRARFFRHINGLCLRFHGKHSSGELFTYVMGSPLSEVSAFYHTLAMNGPNSICLFVSSLLMLGAWDKGMTFILAVSVILTVVSSNSGRNKLRDLMQDFQDTESKVIGRVADIFRGNRDVKMYAIEEKMSATFYQTADVLRQKVYDRDLKTHKVNMLQEGVGIICFVLVCLVSAGRYMNGHLSVGQFLIFMAAFGVLQAPVQLIFQLSVAKGRAQASANRLGEMLNADSTTPNRAAPLRCPKEGALVVRDLTFGYTKDEPVLKDINLTIPYGQSVAFVGPSGSGKSTLAKLFLRLYDPDEGSMSIDDINLCEARTTEIRQRFGVVPQDPYFFSTSIRENLLVVKAQRHRGAHPRGLRNREHLGFYRRAARRPRHDDRRGRCAPERRPAPAVGDRALAAARAGVFRVRRGDQRARHGERAHGAGGVFPHPARQNGDLHRAPAVHHQGLRPHHRPRRRPHHPGRHLRTAAQRAGAVPADGRQR